MLWRQAVAHSFLGRAWSAMLMAIVLKEALQRVPVSIMALV